MRKQWAFIKRRFLIVSSYKTYFFLRLFKPLGIIILFYFISKVFKEASASSLTMYNGNYFLFVFTGIIFSFVYISAACNNFPDSLREEQLSGSLESMLAVPTKISTIAFSLPLWDFIFSLLMTFIYLILGVFFLDIDLSNMNIIATFIVLLLSLPYLLGTSILLGSFVIIFKRIEIFRLIFKALFVLFGGVYFPITLLPAKLQVISYCIPVTYSLGSLRLAMFKGYTIKMLAPDIVILLFFSCVFLFLGISMFKFAVLRAKKRNGLGVF